MNDTKEKTSLLVVPLERKVGLTLRHRRFIYSCGSVYRVGIIHAGTEMWLHLRNAFGEDWTEQFPSESTAFEATFRYASVFVRWLDTEWVETEVPNVKVRGRPTNELSTEKKA